MKKMILAAVFAGLAGLSGLAHSADTCAAQADSKKLNGAARNSFVKKCERDSGASATCEAQADSKKLHGAARNSFVKKCGQG